MTRDRLELELDPRCDFGLSARRRDSRGRPPGEQENGCDDGYAPDLTVTTLGSSG